jgi:plastocyanin
MSITTKMKKILLFLSIIGIIMTSGCNTKRSTDNESIPQNTVSIYIQNSSFEPAGIIIAKGQTVVWKNSDGILHSVKSVTGDFDSGIIKPGQTYSYKFDIGGPYQYYCATHRSMHNGNISVK